MTDLRAQVIQRLEIELAFGAREIRATGTRLPALGGKAEALRALQEEFRDCQLCPLSKTRTKLVFGSGDPEAELLFVGEAPGFDEDQQGLPFVGAAGQLLTKILQAMKLKREQVFIANILKCRPPGNRSPLPTEVVTCHPILAKQIEIIRPKVICALGKFAAQTLLHSEAPISRLRGRFADYNGIRVMPTFHPAYLLRNPADKKLVWEDMKLILGELAVRA